MKESTYRRGTLARRFAVLLALALLATLGQAGLAEASEPVATTTGSRYGAAAYEHTRAKYPEIMAMLSTEAGVPIPGLERTEVREWTGSALASTTCDTMVPQGVCATDKYLLITAYCPHTVKHPSVVYVVNRTSGAFLCCLSLYKGGSQPGVTELTHPDFSGLEALAKHVGGIAYDNADTVWVASGSGTVSSLSLGQIDAAAAKGGAVAVTVGARLTCESQASFLTWYAGLLWAGTNNPTGKGSLRGYDVAAAVNGKLTASRTFVLPEKANGMVFYNVNGRDCLALNVSQGRNDGLRHPDYISRMYLYEADVQGTDELTAHGYYTMPPMAEEMDIRDGKLYTIFESGATKYSAGSDAAEYILDSVCVGRPDGLFYWTDPDFALKADETTAATKAQLDWSYVYEPEFHEGMFTVGCAFKNRFSGNNSTASFFYDDALLMASSHRGSAGPDPELSKVGVSLAAAAYEPKRVEAALENMGFEKVNRYNYGRESNYADNDFVAFSVGQKRVWREGVPYMHYVIAVRGTPKTPEWYSNFNLGTGDDHVGFHLAAAELLDALERDFFARDGADAAHRRVFITGHSRGAAVANIVAGKLTAGDGGRYVNADGVFGYTYACPAVSRNAATSYDNIINFNFSGDPVPTLPLEKWGFRRNGRTYRLDDSDADYANMVRRFGQSAKTSFMGAQDYGSDVADTLSAAIGSQLEYNQPFMQDALEIVVYCMCYDGTGKDLLNVGALMQKHFTRNTEYLASYFGKAISYPTFLYKVDEYETEFVSLVAEVAEARAMDDEKFSEWLYDHQNVVNKLARMADISIKTASELNYGINLVYEQIGNLHSFIDGVDAVVHTFVDSDGKPLTALTHGHTPETYVALINSRYYGWQGWYQSNDVTAPSFPEGLGSVGGGCFYQCKNLTSLEIPTTVRAIGAEGFYNCENLKALTLPVELADLSVFEKTSAITDLRFTVGSTGVMPDLPRQGMINTASRCSLRHLQRVTFDEGITHIGNHAFASYTDSGNSTVEGRLIDVVFPRTLTTIGDMAFYKAISGPVPYPASCTDLESLGYSCFEGCGGLCDDLALPGGLTALGTACFKNCANLTGPLIIPESITELGNEIFYGCKGLTRLDIHRDVTEIGASCFEGCEGLSEVTMPGELADRSAFYKTGHVQTVHFTKGSTGIIPDFESNRSYMKLTGASIGSLKYIDFEEGITYIGRYLCGDVHSYYNNNVSGALIDIGFPSTLEAIGSYAFCDQDRLTNMWYLGENLKSLGGSCFKGCDGLNMVVLPKSLETLGSYCFAYCSKLKTVEFLGDAPERPSNVFERYDIYGSLDAYYDSRNAGWTREYRNGFVNSSSWPIRWHDRWYEIFPAMSFEPDTVALYLTGRGFGAVAPVKLLPENLEDIEEVDIHDLVLEVADESVARLEDGTLVAVGPGETMLTAVLEDHTAQCTVTVTEIPVIVLPDGLTRIEAEAFAQDSALQCVDVPKYCESIGARAFMSCNNLRLIRIPDSVTEIADDAFIDCDDALYIICSEGSAAEDFAIARDIAYRVE